MVNDIYRVDFELTVPEGTFENEDEAYNKLYNILSESLSGSISNFEVEELKEWIA